MVCQWTYASTDEYHTGLYVHSVCLICTQESHSGQFFFRTDTISKDVNLTGYLENVYFKTVCISVYLFSYSSQTGPCIYTYVEQCYILLDGKHLGLMKQIIMILSKHPK